jgi:hypothetical protein
MLREARLCLLGRTGLRRFVAAERFLVRYYEIVFPEFQNFENLLDGYIKITDRLKDVVKSGGVCRKRGTGQISGVPQGRRH